MRSFLICVPVPSMSLWVTITVTAKLSGLISPRLPRLSGGGGGLASLQSPASLRSSLAHPGAGAGGGGGSAANPLAVVGASTVLKCVLDTDPELVPGHLAEVVGVLKEEVWGYKYGDFKCEEVLTWEGKRGTEPCEH